jgi:DNA-binding NtrC family response regulator
MAQTAFILIASKDDDRRQALRDALRERYGHSCLAVSSIEEAIDSVRSRAPDVVVADARIDDRPAAAPLAELLDSLARDAALLVIGATEDELPTVNNIRVRALSDATNGALVSAIADAAARTVARREDRLLKQSIERHRGEAFEGIVGVSPAIQRIKDRIRKAARNKLTVLILGETGTGKELIAEAIHNQSDRARKPFKPLNCAGLNENLLESDLFGHVRGAFTGAVADKKGFFLAADGGTLFLDEIGDMPPAMQAKLLRALERREVIPVGSTEVRRVDVRVIAATNVDLRRAVDEKKFREDLFYRLHQWEIVIPPLRERRDDIPILAHYLLERVNKQNGLSVTGFSSEAMALLTKYLWPGNVREMSNVIERLAWEVENRQIEADDLPESIRGSREIVPLAASGFTGLTIAQMERIMIERALEATSGNREQAAQMLGMSIRTLYRKIKEYGL